MELKSSFVWRQYVREGTKRKVFYIGNGLHMSLLRAFKSQEGDIGKQKLLYRNSEIKLTVTRSPICDLFQATQTTPI